MPHKRPPGRKPHPLDVHLAEQIRKTPNKWHIYPTAERWPDEPDTPEQLKRQYARLTSRTNGKFGPLAATPEGRYRIRLRTSQRRIFVIYIPTETDQ